MRAKQTQKRKDARRAQRQPWVGPLRRLNRALAASRRMIDSTTDGIVAACDRAISCPVRTTRDLHRLSGRLIDATKRLERAARGLGETSVAVLRAPEQAGQVPRLLFEATQRWGGTAALLADVSEHLFALQEAVLHELEVGHLVPEPQQPKRRPRIATAPRINPAREFLLCRRARAHDRVASIPARRRRTACPATTEAPRRICRGRAPPVVSNCLL
ncbi:MAG TPA: hypothetical protein VF111_11465 [Thermoanaerobaculia bacterium]